ncbi:MAG: N-acetylgalactosamine-6-sulfatase, partial [Verrucomicrobiota bacterium]
LDGEDVADAMLGKSEEAREKPIFFRRPPDRPGFQRWGDEDNPDLAVRSGKWKFLINYDKSEPQLYNLEEDISESRNLAADNPELVTEFTEAVFTWNTEMPKDAGDPSYVAPE